jgi:hypothetical protein
LVNSGVNGALMDATGHSRIDERQFAETFAGFSPTAPA